MTRFTVVFSLAIGLGLAGCGDDGEPTRSSCTSTEVECGGVCVDTSSDAANCGACADDGGAICGANEVCSLGMCGLDCAAGLIECGGSCVDPQTDSAYCGATSACDDGDACGADEGCEVGVCEYQGGCADETSEVVWSVDVHGCGGATQSWLLYSEEQATHCQPGWVMAGADIVNSLLVSDAYTDDVMYAYNGEGCDGDDFFATAHDPYDQTRVSCSWDLSHHYSVDDTSDVEGIVCQRQPDATDPRYTGPAGTDQSAGGWVLCGHVPIQGGSLVDPDSTDGLAGCQRRGLRIFMIERSTGICETGDQVGWEYPNDEAMVTLDWQLTNRTNGGWISPSFTGGNTCGVVSDMSWNVTTEVESYDDGPLADGESWIYYQR